jgi:hypothetical protein
MQKLVTIALDRIKRLRPSPEKYISNDLFDAENFFNNLIGVTLPEGETVTDIVINVKPKQAPYIRTKPIHFSQEIVQSNEDGSIQIKLQLINNYETAFGVIELWGRPGSGATSEVKGTNETGF